jgi:hypothetical protein
LRDIGRLLFTLCVRDLASVGCLVFIVKLLRFISVTKWVVVCDFSFGLGLECSPPGFLLVFPFSFVSKKKKKFLYKTCCAKTRIFLGRSLQSSKICVDGDFNPREHIIYIAEKNSKYHSFRNTWSWSYVMLLWSILISWVCLEPSEFIILFCSRPLWLAHHKKSS